MKIIKRYPPKKCNAICKLIETFKKRIKVYTDNKEHKAFCKKCRVKFTYKKSDVKDESFMGWHGWASWYEVKCPSCEEGVRVHKLWKIEDLMEKLSRKTTDLMDKVARLMVLEITTDKESVKEEANEILLEIIKEHVPGGIIINKYYEKIMNL